MKPSTDELTKSIPHGTRKLVPIFKVYSIISILIRINSPYHYDDIHFFVHVSKEFEVFEKINFSIQTRTMLLLWILKSGINLEHEEH